MAKKTDSLDQLAILIEECGGLDKLENLQNHDNEKIYSKAVSLIEQYFSEPVGLFSIKIIVERL